MRRSIVSPALIALSVLAACADTQTSMPLAPDAPLFARGSGGNGGTATDPSAAFYLPAVQENLGLRGDGLYTENNPFAGTSRYREKECGVNSRIFATTEASNSGDAIMNTSNPRYRDRKCGPRTVRVSLSGRLSGSGPTEAEVSTETFINTFNIQNTTTVIPPGATVERPLHISTSTICHLRFRPVLQDGTETGADLVEVTRIDARTWRVRTRPDVTHPDGTVTHGDKAACIDSNGNIVGLYHVPVDFHIIADRDMPVE